MIANFFQNLNDHGVEALFTDWVIYRSGMNPKVGRNFHVFTAPDFLAAITHHIPAKGAQLVRYYGWYSNKMRVIAVIDDRQVVEKILRHLGLECGPPDQPAGRAPPDPGSWIRVPFDDVDPMPLC